MKYFQLKLETHSTLQSEFMYGSLYKMFSLEFHQMKPHQQNKFQLGLGFSSSRSRKSFCYNANTSTRIIVKMQINAIITYTSFMWITELNRDREGKFY